MLHKNSKVIQSFTSEKEIVQYLNIYCTANDINKSDIIGGLLANWYKNQSKKISLKTLVNITREQVERKWRIEKTKGADRSIFCNSMNKFLKKRGFSYDQIDEIINIEKYKLPENEA